MNKLLFAAACAFGCGLSSSAASVGVAVTGVSRDAATGTVTIAYSLESAPCIVTLDILTNAADSASAPASVGGANVRRLSGDVCRIVRTAGAHSVVWYPAPELDLDAETVRLKAEVTAWSLSEPPDYAVADLSVSNSVRFYASADFLPGGVQDRLYKTDKLVLRKIPAAGVEWRMGSPSGENGSGYSYDYWGTTWNHDSGERPHQVKLTYDYYLGVYELTQRQYSRLGGSLKDSAFTGSSYPGWEVRPVSKVQPDTLRGTPLKDGSYLWYSDGHNVKSDSVLGKARAFTGLAELDFPTDAEWEFACRANTTSALYSGKEYSSADNYANTAELAWCSRNANGITHEVGLKKPNGWGLYDLYGNVCEYCVDFFGLGDEYAPSSAGLLIDPKGVQKDYGTSNHVKRGAGFKTDPAYMRSAYRDYCSRTATDENVGFRLRSAATFEDPAAPSGLTGVDVDVSDEFVLGGPWVCRAPGLSIADFDSLVYDEGRGPSVALDTRDPSGVILLVR